MNENELREALRATMTLTPPPPMDSATAVTAGRRAVRRRAALAGAGTVGAAVVLTLAVAPAVLRAGADAVPAGPLPSQTSTEPVWQLDGNGKPQEDATSRFGPRYEQGALLLTELLEAVPDGWTAPVGTAADGVALRDHQARVGGDNSGTTWAYSAGAAVAKDGRTGRLLVEVHTPGNDLPAEPCALAVTFWGMSGDCTVDPSGAGVVNAPGNDRVQQWAAYRHPGGVVVFVAQSRYATFGEPGLEPLRDLPLPAGELAALAAGERFALD